MSETVKLSVRGLVEYVYRSGSIESGFRSARPLSEGTKAHQKIQKKYAESDQKEVYLQTELHAEGLTFLLEGRCDGLLFSEEQVIIDEIKSTARDISSIAKDDYPVHWAQAKCYAYMYASRHHLSEIYVQLTYVHVETEEQKKFIQCVSFPELESFMAETIDRYLPFAKVRMEHESRKMKSITELPFPFKTYREGQRKLAGAVYKTIAEHQTLFANAPTGTGKTISTLFPAVKAIGEGQLHRFFYLTAKTITRTAAEEALLLMKKKGLCLNTVTITAKDKVCFQDKAICQKEHCEFADGYYDRLNGALLDILKNETLMTRTVIEAYARKHTICPFEFSIDLAYLADGVICDYNYVFDPRVSLKRQLEEQKKKTALLVDEAHNLVDRAREMFSADLYKSIFLQIKRLYKGKNDSLYQSASAINEAMLHIRKECSDGQQWVKKELPEEMAALLENFALKAEQELASSTGNETSEELLDAYFSAQSFIRIAQFYDERFVTYAETEKNDVHLKLFCVDPSHQVYESGKKFQTRVYFSATLSPFDYFYDMLGGKEEDYTFSIPSPFSSDQLDVFVNPLSTRYRERERSINPLVNMLVDLFEKRPSNYLVFFPSYRYMNDVYAFFDTETGDWDAMVQDPMWTESEREEFLARYDEKNKRPFIGFAVMGGIFSEGIDLRGDRLNGVVVVGVGLPQLGFEREILKKHFTSSGKNGYDYAYVFPGINKVLQAGGRLIRSEEDRGTLVLVDDRYTSPRYVRMLPSEWRGFYVL